ncbi:MAG: hypothetical protein AMXMBFR75_32490 [Candidatus Hinthialibacteria bacterium]
MDLQEFERVIKRAVTGFQEKYPCLPRVEVIGPETLLILEQWKAAEKFGVYVLFTPGDEKVAYVGKAAPGWIGGRLADKTGKPGKKGDYPSRKPWITNETLYMAFTYTDSVCMFAPALESHVIRELKSQDKGPTQNKIWTKW